MNEPVSPAVSGPAHNDAELTDVRPGQRVAGYRLEEQVGQGGMAVVFRAHDERLDRRVALKLLTPRLAADTSFRARFIRESRAAAAVDHPNIIPVFEAGDAGGALYIAMRYVQGGDVRSLLADGHPLRPDQAWSIVTQVASALDAAHAHGLIHRDVKPANMLLDLSGPTAGGPSADGPAHVYLSDFGISKQALASNITGTGQFVGTLDYIAPEQVEGRFLDGAADQYSLACTAFEMLTGTPPFRKPDAIALITAHLSEAPPPATPRRRELPGAVDAVLARAMAKDARRRYLSCAEFAADLGAALGLLGRPPIISSLSPRGTGLPSAALGTPYGPPDPFGVPTKGTPPPAYDPPDPFGVPTKGTPPPAYDPPDPFGVPAQGTPPPAYSPPDPFGVPASRAPAAYGASPGQFGSPAPPGAPFPALTPPSSLPGQGPQYPSAAGAPAPGQTPPAGYWPDGGAQQDQFTGRQYPQDAHYQGGEHQGPRYPPTAGYQSPGGFRAAGTGAPGGPRGPGWLRTAPAQLRLGRRPIMAAAALVIVIVATIIIVNLVSPSGSGRVPGTGSSASGPSTATAQAAAVEGIVTRSQASRTLLVPAEEAIAGGCAKLSPANFATDVRVIQTAAGQRRLEYADAKNLRTNALPNGASLKASLVSMLFYSHQADADYATWARQEQRQCAPNSKSAAFNAAYAASVSANQAKARFVVLWNQVASKYGYPPVTEATV